MSFSNLLTSHMRKKRQVFFQVYPVKLEDYGNAALLHSNNFQYLSKQKQCLHMDPSDLTALSFSS